MEFIEGLEEIGLSEYEAKVYVALLAAGDQASKQIAEKSKVPRTRVFDTLEKLTDRGLVQLIQQKPMIWAPIKPKLGLKNLIEKKISSYGELEKQLIEKAAAVKEIPEEQISEKVTITSSFEGMFSSIGNSFKEARKSIEVYSVGEEIPSRVAIEAARAIRRNVRCRMIATQYGEENKSILQNWINDGWKIKYLRGSKEYTFVIIDNALVIIVIKNPKIKDERITILFDNPDLSFMFFEYFDVLWKKGRTVG